MIISKTPFRVSFIGGGSDLRSFYKHEPGCVISTSINKTCIFQCRYFYDNQSLIKYSSTENVKSVDEIKHNIIREVFRLFKKIMLILIQLLIFLQESGWLLHQRSLLG